ncbi:YifB family Mg chelatase-like AAA ATPase [Brooklawnia sp.]|uniref:YifB family Mg chelatase-like AAA ATPase n=1 Tax=Brooklawnia sp. TaxID=2699740 RepID=UPI00311F36F6
MSTASAWSVALLGMEGTLVEVEAAIGGGLPRTVLVGLPDAALYEARDRCRAAVAGAGLAWPNQLLTINLTPASLPKAGSHYDLAIVSAVLVASGIVPRTIAASSVLVGELGLDGRVREVHGVLPALLAARGEGFTTAIVAAGQVAEAELVDGLTIWGVSCLADLIEVLHGRPVLGQAARSTAPTPQLPAYLPDLADVRGQPDACWALEVAAAGGHHIFLHGAPGVGKSMLAERLPGVLPDLRNDEALEVSAVHSLAGRPLTGGLIRRPPYSNPHHNASMAAMIGGGARVARPGAISVAHRGVLFLDEVAEFSARVLDALRTPMETGKVTIARSVSQVCYPARFQLVMAANPCPCGMLGVPGRNCSCTPMSVRRYNERLSGPILDRIDIHHRLLPSRLSLAEAPAGEPSAKVAERVALARQRQARRLAGTPWRLNGEVPGAELRKLPQAQGMSLLDDAVRCGRLSARGIDKVLRIGWTLADLDGTDRITRTHLASALGLRQDSWRSAA